MVLAWRFRWTASYRPKQAAWTRTSKATHLLSEAVWSSHPSEAVSEALAETSKAMRSLLEAVWSSH
jgi:hypothetical protein